MAPILELARKGSPKVVKAGRFCNFRQTEVRTYKERVENK